jgi:hypothetical protein
VTSRLVGFIFKFFQEDETNKKRKIVVEIEKGVVKKVVSKVTKAGTLAKTLTSKQPPALGSSTAYNTSQAALPSSSNDTAPNPKATKVPAAPPTNASTNTKATTKGKSKAVTKVPEEQVDDPSYVVQTQMAARVKAQIQAAKKAAPAESEVPSESIELPDINSEYSDSDDENQPRTFDPPGWAQSPELRQALQMQSTMNPDDIFGAIRPLRMEEMFRARTSRFRARTSSANWAGVDRLTQEEEREYVRRMGFR